MNLDVHERHRYNKKNVSNVYLKDLLKFTGRISNLNITKVDILEDKCLSQDLSVYCITL